MFNILPKADAAAVWIIPLHFSSLKCSTKPITVKGLTIPDAAEETGTSFYISKVVKGLVTAYWHQEPFWEVKQTLFPIQLCTASPLASTTVPAP